MPCQILSQLFAKHPTVKWSLMALVLLVMPLASSYAYIGSVDITPGWPDTNDVITIHVMGWYPDACWSPTGSSFSQVGDTFNYNFSAYFSGGPICLLIVIPYGGATEVGPLPAGDYTVEVSDGMGASESRTFTVGADVSCCSGIRGDVDGQPGDDSISDLVYLVDWMFNGGPEPGCIVEVDFNDDGRVDIADLVWLVDYMFNGGVPPADCP